MKALTAADILSAKDLEREKVEVPEWGGFVFISAMSGTARDAFEASCMTIKDGKGEQNLENIRAKMVAATAADEAGDLLFSTAQVEELGKKSGAVLDRLFAVAQRVNGITDAEVDELAKNS